MIQARRLLSVRTWFQALHVLKIETTESCPKWFSWFKIVSSLVHSRSIKSFYQALYVDPGFSRANEIHLRLGLIFKQNKNFAAALKHFNCALNDQAECSKSRLQIRFYVAHLHESQGKCCKAKDLYLRLVEDPSLPLDVKADTYRYER